MWHSCMCIEFIEFRLCSYGGFDYFISLLMIIHIFCSSAPHILLHIVSSYIYVYIESNSFIFSISDMHAILVYI
jgi:hypothetical protein